MKAKALDRFPVIRSRNVEEVREAFSCVYARPALVPTHGVENFDTHMNMCVLQNVALGYNAFGAALELDFPETGFFCQLLPIRGTGEISFGSTSIGMTAGAGAVISSETPHKRSTSADYEHLTMRTRCAGVDQKTDSDDRSVDQ